MIKVCNQIKTVRLFTQPRGGRNPIGNESLEIPLEQIIFPLN